MRWRMGVKSMACEQCRLYDTRVRVVCGYYSMCVVRGGHEVV